MKKFSKLMLLLMLTVLMTAIGILPTFAGTSDISTNSDIMNSEEYKSAVSNLNGNLFAKITFDKGNTYVSGWKNIGISSQPIPSYPTASNGRFLSNTSFSDSLKSSQKTGNVYVHLSGEDYASWYNRSGNNYALTFTNQENTNTARYDIMLDNETPNGVDMVLEFEILLGENFSVETNEAFLQTIYRPSSAPTLSSNVFLNLLYIKANSKNLYTKNGDKFVCTLSETEFIRLSVAIHPETNTFDIYVNGTPAVSDETYALPINKECINYCPEEFRIFPSNTNNSLTIDNVYCYESSKPVLSNDAVPKAPENMDGGKTFIAWKVTDKSGNVSYKFPGDAIRMENIESIEPLGIKLGMLNGASLSSDGKTLRFVGKISKSDYDALDNLGIKVTTHMLITPTSELSKTQGIFTKNALEAWGASLKNITVSEWFAETDGYYYFVGSSNEITNGNTQKFSATAYIDINIGGKTVTVYSGYSETANSRSLYDIALSAYSDRTSSKEEGYPYSTPDGNYSPYTSTVLSKITEICKKVIVLNSDGNSVKLNTDKFYSVSYNGSTVTVTGGVPSNPEVLFNGKLLGNHSVSNGKLTYALNKNAQNIPSGKITGTEESWYLTYIDKETVYVPYSTYNTNPAFTRGENFIHRADKNNGVVTDGNGDGKYTTAAPDSCFYEGNALKIVSSLPSAASNTFPSGASDFGTKFIKWQFIDLAHTVTNTISDRSYTLGIGGVNKMGWTDTTEKSPNKYSKYGYDETANGYFDFSDGNGNAGWESLAFYVYNDTSVPATLQYQFISYNAEVSGNHYYSKTITVNPGWNHIVLSKNDFVANNSPSWNKIRHITINPNANNLDGTNLYFTSTKMYDYKIESYGEIVSDGAAFTVGGFAAFSDGKRYVSSEGNVDARAFKKDGKYYISANILASMKGTNAQYYGAFNTVNYTYGGKSYYIGEGLDNNNLPIKLTSPAILKNGAVFITHEDAMSIFGYTHSFIATNGVIILSNKALGLDNKENHTYALAEAIADDLIYIRPSDEVVKTDLTENALTHPYIMMKESDFSALRSYYRTDNTFKKYVSAIEEEFGVGSPQYNGEPVNYEIRDGVRLLYVSREALAKLMSWSTLYNLYKEDNAAEAILIAERIWKELEAINKFVDWHPVHYLDTAELAYPVAIAYDWLYDYWTPAQRGIIEGMLYGFALKTTSTLGGSYKLASATNNWSSVCNGGAITAALALWNVQNDVTWKANSTAVPKHGETAFKVQEYVDRDDVTDGDNNVNYETVTKYKTKAADIRADAFEIIMTSISAIENCVWSYAPDGGYMEGPGYWGYGTTYHHVLLAALDSACGTNYGIYYAPGFEDSAYFVTYVASLGELWNFHDASSSDAVTTILPWFAKKSGDGNLNAVRRMNIENGWTTISYYDIIHYSPTILTNEVTLSKDKLYTLDSVMTFRDSWDNEKGLFAGLHGGSNNASHGDLDTGNFVITVNGVEMITDFGQENYNVSGLAGNRWAFYRKRAEGHNTIVMRPTGTSWDGTTGDPKGADANVIDKATPDQTPMGLSNYKKFESNNSSAFGVIDMKSAYTYMTSGQRGLYFGDNRSTIIIQDEATFSESMDVWWFAHTTGDITILNDGKSAIIKQPGVYLYAEIVTKQNFVFSKMEAKSLDSKYDLTHYTTEADPTGNKERSNSSYEKLCIKLTNISTLKLAVAFKVIESEDDIPADSIYTWKNISDWTLEKDVSDSQISCTHDIVYYPTVSASCIEGGNIGHYKCSLCEKLFSDANGVNELSSAETPKTSHTKAPATDGGNGHHITCSVCHSAVDFTSHSYGEYISDYNATKDTDGTKTAHCTLCGRPDTVTDEGSRQTYNLKFNSVALMLHDDISVHFSISPELLGDIRYSDLKATLKIGSRTEIAPLIYNEDTDRYIFSICDIPANMMSDILEAQITATLNGNTVYGKPAKISIKEYCEVVFKNSVSNTEKQLIADILNYGAAAQAYAGEIPDANQSLSGTDYYNSYLTLNLSQLNNYFVNTSKVQDPLVEWIGTELIDTQKIAFVFKTSEDISNLNVVVKSKRGSTKIDLFTKDGNMYYFIFDGITAAQMDEEFTFEFQKDGKTVSDILHYSITTFASENALSFKSEPTLESFVKSMIKYGQSAKAYADSKTQN